MHNLILHKPGITVGVMVCQKTHLRKMYIAFEKDVYSIIRLNEAHQKLLRCTAEDDLKGMKEVLKQKIDITYVPILFSDGTRYKPATQEVDINVNYVQAFFRDGVRYEHTALIIALQRGCSEAINFLIEKGADLNQALSLAFLYFSKESSPQADLISRGADIEKACKLAIGHDWDDEIQEKRGLAKILWQALMHQPDNLLLHTYLMSQGADINEALVMAVETAPEEQLVTVMSNLNSQEADVDINYVQAFFRDGVRYEHTALIIALQRGCSEAINFLIEKGADLDQALSLAFLYFSKESSLQADLISRGADIEKACKLAIGHDWDDEIQEKRGKARILWQALVYQPDNLLFHVDLMLQGADINLTLCTVVFNEPENKEMQSRLISMGANFNEALVMAVKTAPEEQLETVMSNLISQGADADKALSLALRHKPGNDELISKRASLNRVLSFAVQNHPDDDKLISTLISKGADANYVVDCEKNYRILHQAIDRGCSEKVIRCLLKSGAKANEKMIVDKGGSEQIVFAMLTLSNPIGWFYLSYLFCVRGDCGNPFTKKRINAIDLARLNHNDSVAKAIAQYKEGQKKANEKTALLKKRETTYGLFLLDEKKSECDEVFIHPDMREELRTLT